MPEYHVLDQPHKIGRFLEIVEERAAAGKPVTVCFQEPHRSNSQNALIYHLYGKIARQKQDMTTQEVIEYCKLHYGIPIMRTSDAAFCERYDREIKPLPYETKLWIVGHMDVTSTFSKEEATDYINSIIQGWGKLGIFWDEETLSRIAV